MMRHIGSHGFDFDEDAVRTLAEEMWERGPQPAHQGVSRQLAAIFKSGDRTRALRQITAPTLVIHVTAIAWCIPAEALRRRRRSPAHGTRRSQGWGTISRRGVWPRLTGLIATHARAATPAGVG